MRGLASAKAFGHKPTSLMQRLALVSGGRDDASEIMRSHYRPGMAAYFGLGLSGGAVAGAVVLAVAAMLAPATQPQSDVPPAIAALADWVSGPERAIAAAAPPRMAAQEVPLEAFDVTIDRTMRADAPFGLQLIGTGSPAGMEVVLRDVPSAVLPSRGAKRGASTWVLAAADLEGLRLALAEGTPDTFEVRIDVVAPSGAVAANSLARVRVVDVPGPERKNPLPLEAAPAGPQAPVARTAEVDARSHTRGPAPQRAAGGPKVARAAPPRTPAPAAVQPEQTPTVEERHWPEGASGLGAVPHASERQVWWKLPAPSWSPFQDAAAPR